VAHAKLLSGGTTPLKATPKVPVVAAVKALDKVVVKPRPKPYERKATTPMLDYKPEAPEDEQKMDEPATPEADNEEMKGEGIRLHSRSHYHHKKAIEAHKSNVANLDNVLNNLYQQRRNHVGVIEKPKARELLDKIKHAPQMIGEGISQGKPLKCEICGEGRKSDDSFHLTNDNEVLHNKCFVGRGMTKKRKLRIMAMGDDITEDNPRTKKLYMDDQQNKFYESVKNIDFKTVHDEFEESVGNASITPNILHNAQSHYIAGGKVNDRYINNFVYLYANAINHDLDNAWLRVNINVMRAKILLADNRINRKDVVTDLNTSHFGDLKKQLVDNSENLRILHV
jgi:hypothetical protein